VKTDHWFYGLFQSAPDLITLLLPQGSLVAPLLGPDAPGDALYRFEAPELKAANHRLGAQSLRFLQLHPQVLHLAVVVLVPHRRLNLGPAFLPKPLQAFIDCVDWLSLEELGQQVDLDPLLALLTLPVRPEAELQASSQRILKRRPDLLSAVQTILLERLPLLTREKLMEIATIPAKDLRHTRVAQEWIEEGRQEGLQEGEASVTLRQLNRRCGPLSDATAARIKALPLGQLEALAEALLDFSGPADLAAWLAEHSG
jgi:hypothetical protein